MRRHSILLVEDDDNDVFFFQDALRRAEIDIALDIVNDGQEAIDFLTSTSARTSGPEDLRPGFVLLDLNLPRRTGFDVLTWIRQHTYWKTLIVVVLTSSTSEADMHQAYSLGANSYVVKPTDATRLRVLIKLLVEYWLGWNENPPVTVKAGTPRFLQEKAW
jgi:DNA-binding response OmpR family regulator